MPVQTRSQTKNSVQRENTGIKIVIESFNLNRRNDVKNQVKNIVNNSSSNLNEIIEKENWFRSFMMKRLAEHEHLKGQENLLRNSYEMMYIAHSELPDILRKNPSKWTRFAKTVYNKAYDFEYYTDYESNIEMNRVNEFLNFLHGLRGEFLKLFKELKISIEFKNSDYIQDTGYINMN